MSDVFVPAGESATVPEAPAPTPETAASVTPEAGTPDPPQEYQWSGSVEEASAEIRRLRDENAQRRLAAKQYDETLGSFKDEERAAWLELGKLWKTDPQAAREAFRELAQIEAAQQVQQQQENPGQITEPLNEARLREILQERDLEQARNGELMKIDAETTKLGLKPGTLEYSTTLQLALEKTNGNIPKAHQMFQEYVQSQVQAEIDKLRQGGAPAPPPVAGGPSISQTEAPKTLKEARQRAGQFLQDWNNAQAQQ